MNEFDAILRLWDDVFPRWDLNTVGKALSAEAYRGVEEILRKLSRDEETVLRAIYGFGCRPMTLKETGVLIDSVRHPGHVGPTRVVQIRDRARRRLRERAFFLGLTDVLGIDQAKLL